MALIYPNIVRALFRLDGGNPPVMAVGGGVSSTVVRNGAGNYQITLSQGIDDVACSFLASSIGTFAANAAHVASVVHTNETSKQILYSVVDANAGTVALSDTPAFSWALFGFPGQ